MKTKKSQTATEYKIILVIVVLIIIVVARLLEGHWFWNQESR
jgi:uncharacterized protein (UPF0333 family)